MTIFGLNSPELFVLLLITLIILGTKRIEKGLDLLSRLLKFLLSNQSSIYNNAEEKEPIQDIEEPQKKEEDITKIEEKPTAEEKELTQDIEEPQKKEEEITKSEGKPTAEEKKTIKNIEETPVKEDKLNKKLKIANVVKEQNNSAKIRDPKGIEKNKPDKNLKTKNPKRIVKDKTVLKSKTINVQEEKLEK